MSGSNLNNSSYAFENNLYELFTEEETSALKEYLLNVHEKGYTIKEVDLSLEAYTLGYGDMVLEEKEGYYKLNEEDRYNLPLVIRGYYDVSSARNITGIEPVSGIITQSGQEKETP